MKRHDGQAYRSLMAQKDREIKQYKSEAWIWRNAFAIAAHGVPGKHEGNSTCAEILAELDRRMPGTEDYVIPQKLDEEQP